MKTGEVERRVLRVSWGGFRWALGMRTRHRMERPTTMPAEIRRGEEWIDVMLPVSEYTGAAAFPIFREPPVLHQIDEDELKWASMRTILASGAGAVPTDSPATRAGADRYRIPIDFDPKAIARMVAKIAHGYAVDLFGLDGFIPYLPPAIIGDSDDIGRWVGSPGGKPLRWAGRAWAPHSRRHGARYGGDHCWSPVVRGCGHSRIPRGRRGDERLS